jgi:PAS domain-containing protein
MNRQFPAPLNASLIVVPILAGTIAAGIFILDTVAPLDVALAVLYVAVVLIAARFLQRRGVLLVALGCGGLAVASYAISLQGPPSTVALVNLVIGLAAIGISTYLALLNQASEIASRERASLLDVAHEALFVRDLDEAITYWNRGAEERYRWTSEQALGKISHQLLHTVFGAARSDQGSIGEHRSVGGRARPHQARWVDDRGGEPVVAAEGRPREPARDAGNQQ